MPTMEPIGSRLFRNGLAVVWWAGISFAALATTGVLAFANYLALSLSFTLLGTDRKPLHTDELFGSVLGGLLGDAQLAHLLAAIIAAGIALGLLIIFDTGFTLFDVVTDRREYRRAGDAESARAADRIIYDLALQLGLLVILLGVVIYWDALLFRYRSVAGALNMEDPEVAAASLQRWDLTRQQLGDRWAIDLASIGAWAYVSATTLACATFEVTTKRLSNRFSLLVSNLVELLEGEDELQAEGADESRPDDPGLAPAGEAAEMGSPLPGPTPTRASGNTEMLRVDGAAAAAWPQPAAVDHSADGSSDGEHGEASGWWAREAGRPHGPAPEPDLPPAAAAPTSATELFDVIAAPTPTRVTWEEALADAERFHVDLSAGRVWDRQYHQTLHEPPALAAD